MSPGKPRMDEPAQKRVEKLLQIAIWACCIMTAAARGLPAIGMEIRVKALRHAFMSKLLISLLPLLSAKAAAKDQSRCF